jgi:nucleoside-diphosphate-sugar epimerase
MFTVLGGHGYIGSNLAAWLRSRAARVWTPERGADLFATSLGHVIYCVAVTTDVLDRPYETVRANVDGLVDLLERARFDSLLYLSSAHLYTGCERASEDAVVGVDPSRPWDLYRISKLMGESVCHASRRPEVRVARLSTVYGRNAAGRDFLSLVVRSALQGGRVVLRTTLDSQRDFVSIDDVVRILPRIAQSGRRRVYNVASGRNTSNASVMSALRRETGCAVEVEDGADTFSYPPVDIGRIREELGFAPSASIVTRMGEVVREYQAALGLPVEPA